MKKTLCTLILALAGAVSATAQLVIHDVSPDTTLTAGPTLQYFSVRPPSVAEFDLFQDPANEVYIAVHGFYGNGEVLFDGGFPAKLNRGTLVSSSGTWVEAGNDPLNRTGTVGNWITAASDNYLGIRFTTISGGSGWHYGWIRLGVAADGSSFTIKSWGYNVIAGMPMVADDGAATGIPELIQVSVIDLVHDGQQIRFTGLSGRQRYEVQITDLNGRAVLQQPIQYADAISTSQLASGVYIVQLSAQGTVYRFKTAW